MSNDFDLPRGIETDEERNRKLEHCRPNEVVIQEVGESRVDINDFILRRKRKYSSSSSDESSSDDEIKVFRKGKDKDKVEKFLKQVNLPELIPIFKSQQITMEDINEFSQEDLESIGVKKYRDRRIILNARAYKKNQKKNVVIIK